jgi:hypothetical protein
MDTALMAPIRITMPDGAPKIIRKEMLPDQRQIVVLPLRAFKDKRMTAAQLRVLGICCSYANKAGLLWAGLERIGRDLCMSKAAAFKQVKKLEEFGYIKTIYKGFAGERAATRQIIFNPDITARQAMQQTGDQAPFAHQQQQRKQRKAAKQSAKKQQENSTTTVNQPEVNQSPMQSVHDVMQLKNKVSDKIWQLAIQRANSETDYAAIKAAIDKLLR